MKLRKTLNKLNIVLILLALSGMIFSVGCDGESIFPEIQNPPVSGSVTETPKQEANTPSPEPVVVKSAPYGILVQITHEAGEALTGEEFRSGYEGNISVKNGLSDEELKTIGKYRGTIDCDGREVDVSIKVTDTTPPTLIGASDIEINQGDNIAYKKGIEYSDNSNGELELVIKKDNVDTNTPGEYPVTYTLSDSMGNVTEKTITVRVRGLDAQLEQLVNDRADEVIASVTNASMTNLEKAYAVFCWCHDNLTYKGDEVELTYHEAAYSALFKNSGDCYVSYVLLDLLYKRLGFETMMLERVGGTSDHYWNYVNYGEGWYHCDCIRRHTGKKAFDDYLCFMQTDAQVQGYNDLRGDTMPNCYTYDKSKVPACDTFAFYDGNTHEFIKDSEAPVIKGAVDIYICPGESVAYKKNIVVTDNSGEDISVHVKNSGVDLKTIGVYPVTYYAEDSAGNYSEVTVNVHVCNITPDMVNEIADNLLSTIIKDDMTLRDKAWAIYAWIANHVAYVDSESGTDPVKAAYDGLTKYKGDCYVFGQMAQLLLTRAGIDAILVTKEPVGTTDHYWSIVNTGDGWYHFDSTPWWDKAQIFMWTDSQLEKYSNRPAHGEGYYPTHPYDKSKYPEVVK